MNELTANEYQRLAMRTAGVDKDEWLMNAILGLNGEAGECADLVKKTFFQGHPYNKGALMDEAGDVCWYLALLCSALGTTLEEVMKRNIEKLMRRYPDGFDPERSVNRTE